VTRRERGQALVEFSLVALIFFTVLFGLIEGARFVYTDNMLNNAAREGARTGSVQAGWIGQSGNGCNTAEGQVCPTPAVFGTNVLAASNRELIGANPLIASNLTLTCGLATPSAAACTPGVKLTVTATYTYVPFLPVLNRTSIQLTGTSSMVIQ
jgi:Flp pilus assembly protein TadG